MDQLPVLVRKNPNTAAFVVTWVLTNKCQNSCRYCPPDLHNGRHDLYSCQQALAFLDQVFARHEKIHFSFAGGEPTAASHFVPILNAVRERNGTVSITTNGRKPVGFWREFAEKIYYVNFSYHTEFEADDASLLERLTVIGERTHLGVRVMMLPERWQQCLDFIAKFAQSNVMGRLEVVRILPDFGGDAKICQVSYSPEQESFLTTFQPIARFNPALPRLATAGGDALYSDGSVERLFDANTWVSRQITNFKGWTCHIGLDSLFVGYGGGIFRGNCAVGGQIGSLITGKISWPISPVVCTDHLCHCTTDVYVQKYKSVSKSSLVNRIKAELFREFQ